MTLPEILARLERMEQAIRLVVLSTDPNEIRVEFTDALALSEARAALERQRERELLAKACAEALRAHAVTYADRLPASVVLRLQMSADVMDPPAPSTKEP